MQDLKNTWPSLWLGLPYNFFPAKLIAILAIFTVSCLQNTAIALYPEPLQSTRFS